MGENLTSYTREGLSASYLFHSFVPGGEYSLIGKYNYYGSDPNRAFLTKACIAPYTVYHSNQTIFFDEDNQKCYSGYFDRVSVWHMNDTAYLALHTDR